jgi:hypothetical protein
MVGSFDHDSPIAAGQMLFFPDELLYHEGLTAMRYYGPALGWNGSGTPLELLGSRVLRRWDGSVLKHYSKNARIDYQTWDFGGGPSDQGFLVYMLLYRQDAFRYANHGSLHQVRHHANGGGIKPWERAVATETVGTNMVCLLHRYIQRLRLSGASAGWCAQQMRREGEKLDARIRDVRIGRFPHCLSAIVGQCHKDITYWWPFPLL